MNRILIIDFCNYQDYPIGGYLTRAKNLMVAFGNDLALVGITCDKNDPIGKWFKKSIGSIDFDFFAYRYYSRSKTQHLIPDRVVSYFYTKKYRKEILHLNINNIFIQRQEILQSTKYFGFKNTCFCFAGLENPVAISKYWYVQNFAKYLEKHFFKSLMNVQSIIAAGDHSSIDEMVARSNGLIKRESVVQFPTRINTDIFKIMNKNEVREHLNIPDSVKIVVTTGRLSWLKGWKLMLDSFFLFEKLNKGSLFFMVGDGEDKSKIEEYIAAKELVGKVFLVGKKDTLDVALYLNAADLFIMGSYKEGWSTSLIEAIACGIPACVTNFSSAKNIIIEGQNGFVIEDHNVELFLSGMQKCIQLMLPVYNENVLAYSVNKFKGDLLKVWTLV